MFKHKMLIILCMVLLSGLTMNVMGQHDIDSKRNSAFVNMERDGIAYFHKNLGYKMEKELDKNLKKRKYRKLLNEGDTLVYSLFAYSNNQFNTHIDTYRSDKQFTDLKLAYSNVKFNEQDDTFTKVINTLVKQNRGGIIPMNNEVYLRFFITKVDKKVKTKILLDRCGIATFPDGYIAMEQFVYHNMKYPKAAFDNRLSGRCLFSADVDEDGNLNNISLLEGFDKECDEEAMRLVNAMPKWEPCKINGKPIYSHVTIPIDLKYQFARLPLSYKEIDDIQDALNSYEHLKYTHPNRIKMADVNMNLLKEDETIEISSVDYSVFMEGEWKELEADQELIDVLSAAVKKATPVIGRLWKESYPLSNHLTIKMRMSKNHIEINDISRSSAPSSEDGGIFIGGDDIVDPEYPGGINGLMQYLGENINYPEQAKYAGIQGRIFLNFIVEADGAVSGIKVLRGIGQYCDREAMRVVANMKKWTPGTRFGIPVRVSFNLPIKFTLQ